MSKKEIQIYKLPKRVRKKSSENTISPTYFKIIFYKITMNDNNWSIHSVSNYPFPPRPINFSEYLTVLPVLESYFHSEQGMLYDVINRVQLIFSRYLSRVKELRTNNERGAAKSFAR